MRAIIGLVGIIAISVAVTTFYTFWLPSDYFAAMISLLEAEPPDDTAIERSRVGRAFRMGKRKDWQISSPNYFFGPMELDIKQTLRSTSERCVNHFKSGAGFVSRSLDTGDDRDLMFAVGVAAGIGLGAVIGVVITLAIAMINVLLAVVILMVTVILCTVLRSADTMLRFMRGIVIRCPNSECSRPVRPYPAYRCPCGELHLDIRPGPFGIVLRVCKCERRLPTLLLVGSGRLAAVCQECNTELPAGIGKAAEIVVPIFGSVNAGKTQLIYTLSLAVRKLADDSRAVVAIDDRTNERLGRIGEVLAATGNTRPTVTASPEPYIMRLKLGLNQRLLYLFDAAGELHYNLPTLENLGYLDKGRTLIFVADPLATDVIWLKLPEAERKKHAGGRSNAVDAQIAYEQTREQMRRMGRRIKRIRLAFVVSKADLLKAAMPADYASRADIRKLVVDPAGMDMGNQVRDAEQAFKSVEFIATTAIADEDGLPHESIAKLAAWILMSEGITVRGTLGSG